MRKTSVYLPEELKSSLADVAHRWGRSEADLIRLAVERLIDGAEPTIPAAVTPAPPFGRGARLVGIGVGPGDPSLITARAVAGLRAAGTVFAASVGPDAVGRAEAVVRTVAPEVDVRRLAIDIAGPRKRRTASLDAAAAELLTTLEAGEPVAFVTLGDPGMWSTFPALARRVQAKRPSLEVEAIPGIMAFQDVAARAGIALASSPEEQVLLLAVDSDDLTALDAALRAEGAANRTVAVTKGGGHLPAIATALERHGRLEGATVGELLGLPGGRSTSVAAVADRPASYLAAVIVPAKRARA